MALDSTSGAFSTVQLNYTLSLSSGASTGTGLAQSFTIGGQIAGGQSGTCATATCSDTDSSHTLTITY